MEHKPHCVFLLLVAVLAMAFALAGAAAPVAARPINPASDLTSSIVARPVLAKGGMRGAPTGPHVLPGGSTVSGVLSSDDIWGPGTITVTGDIVINAGVTIDIVPGTTVQMAINDGGDLGFDATHIEYMVAGTLRAQGPVTFTSQSQGPACQDWVGINFLAGGAGYLQDTLVEYGVHAVEIHTTNPITIADSTLRHNCHLAPPFTYGRGAGLLIDKGTHLITNTMIYDNFVVAGLGSKFAEGGGVEIVYPAGPSLFENCTLYDNHAQNVEQDAAGGGMNIGAADPILRHCEIFSNSVTARQRAFGGGVNLDNSSAVLEANTFIHDNNAFAQTSHAWGGGVSIGEALMSVPPAPVIRDSKITTNTCQTPFDQVTALWCFGGGIGFYGGSWTQTVISGTVVADNQNLGAAAAGGGIGMDGGASADHFDGNLVVNNVAQSGGWGAYGGGVCLFDSNPVTVSNSLVFHNLVDGAGRSLAAHGGGIYADGPGFQLVNNTVVSNTTANAFQTYGGGVFLDDGNLFSTIVVDNTAGPHGGGGADGGGVFWQGGVADYNDVWNNACLAAGCGVNYSAPGVPPANDIVADPLFIGSGDVATRHHLAPRSPCVDQVAAAIPGIPYLDHDYDGDSRPINVKHDIGFDEVLAYIYLPLVVQD